MFDDQARLVISNDGYRQMYNMPPKLVRSGTTFSHIIRQRKLIGTFVGEPEQFCGDLIRKLAQGSIIKTLSQIEDGRIISVSNQPMDGGGWVSIHEDITEQHTAREALEQTKRFLDTVIESVPIPIVVKDANSHRFVLVNQAYEAFFGLPRGRLIGGTVFDLYPAADAERIAGWDDEVIRLNKPQVNSEIHVVTPANGDRVVTATRLVVSDGNNKPQYLIVVMEDITEKKKASEKIAFMAHHDALTGLPNRALLRERLDEALTAVRTDNQLAVLFLDLDHFKTVNDTLGHLIGDELLGVVAERLRACIQANDTVARLGGDEFAIIQTTIADPSDISDLAQRIRAAVTSPYDLGGLRAVIDVSIGISRSPHDGAASVDLMKRADLALYKAKGDGRGTFRFFEPEMDARMKARRLMESDLRNAIVRDEFQLLYQPIVKIRESLVEGVEGLLRWNHPVRGVISPSEFISAAEETGLIVPLGEWVIRRACSDAANWPRHIKVAINLSPVQFTSKNLASVVIDALESSGVAADRLELEITEEMLLSPSQANLDTLEKLQSRGVQIVMDDFGTGYSSLNYLRRFDFDRIKIDRSFVDDLTSGNELSLAIVQTIARLANALKVPTTAEGVETAEQLQLVTAAGCTHFQGYFFSRPVPATQVDELFSPKTHAGPNAA